MRFVQREEKVADAAAAERLSQELRLPLTAARALTRRGVCSASEAECFLHPDRQAPASPFLLTGMNEAVMTLKNAIAAGKRICVYGDYDADGVCAVAILLRALRPVSDTVSYYIPSRHNEGYGMNRAAILHLHEEGVELIVTVDNGVAAFDEVELALSLGMQLILTDHHRAHDRIPAATAVLLSEKSDTEHPFYELCGAGVAYELACALDTLPSSDVLLPYAALATVADVVPLRRENRSIVVRGLKYLRESVGLAALLKVAGVREDAALNADTLSYVLAPRMNAAGRMGDASKAAELLLTDDAKAAEQLALALDTANTERRDAEASILMEALSMIQEGALSDAPAMVLYGKDWNAGVIGIVSARVSERFDRPAILFTDGEEGVLSGSGRSGGSVDLFDTLGDCTAYMTRYGGHAAAAGVSIRKEALKDFTDCFCKAVLQRLGGELPEPVRRYEDVLTLGQIDTELCDALKTLAPFGEGNPEPTFLLKQIPLRRVVPLGKDGKHLQAQLGVNAPYVRMVAFGMGDQLQAWQGYPTADVIVRLRINEYQDKRSAGIYCQALKPCEEPLEKSCEESKIIDAFLAFIRYNKLYGNGSESVQTSVRSLAEQLPRFLADEERLRRAYRELRKRIDGGEHDLKQLLIASDPITQYAAAVFIELGFLSTDAESRSVTAVKRCPHRALTESRLYSAMLESMDART